VSRVTTKLEFIEQVREIVGSYMTDRTVRAALEGLIALHVDVVGHLVDLEDHSEPLTQRNVIDEAYKRGVAEGQANMETVAAQRDALITKLHALGNKPHKMTAKQIMEAKRAAAALGWIAKKPPPEDGRARVRWWRSHEELPTVPGWYALRDAAGGKCDAYWDGLDFVISARRRLLEREQWAPIALKKPAK
jgi:hypothetical protein